MAARNLEEVLRASGDVVGLLRNSKSGIYIYPVVAPEFSNWRTEQQAWRDSAVLFDQSHHMAELTVEGSDAGAFLEGLGINSFKGFTPGKAKHYVPVSHSGHVIGDVILFNLDGKYVLVGRAPTINWIEYNATRHGSVKTVRDDRSPSRPDGKAVSRQHYRFQVQGPNADRILEKLHGGPLPTIKFFNMDWINVAGRKVRALRHGMAGAPGLELFGPYAEKDEIRDAIMEAGKAFDLYPVGSRAYATNTLESGWIPSPLPAVYTDPEMEDYRKWLPADSYEAAGGSIGGSYVSADIRDYYSTPYELGYGFYVKFDHDFIGRKALEAMQDRKHRRKVTFEWNAEDVVNVIASAFKPGEAHAKWIDFPLSNYASSSFDRVERDGKLVGLSMFNGYSYNERCMLSLGFVDDDVKQGDVLTLIWGEPGGGSDKTSTEKHRQAKIRVRVSAVPYAREARENYQESWRTRSA